MRMETTVSKVGNPGGDDGGGDVLPVDGGGDGLPVDGGGDGLRVDGGGDGLPVDGGAYGLAEVGKPGEVDDGVALFWI